MEININVKRCSKCQEEKSIELFGVKNYNKDGLNHYCKECENNRTKIRYQDPIQKEKIKYNSILRNYGLTKEEYLLKLDNQEHKCSICSDVLKNDRKTHVDHCHLTGVVRDILCDKCNKLLGNVKEDVNYLKNLINYIEKYSPQK